MPDKFQIPPGYMEFEAPLPYKDAASIIFENAKTYGLNAKELKPHKIQDGYVYRRIRLAKRLSTAAEIWMVVRENEQATGMLVVNPSEKKVGEYVQQIMPKLKVVQK